MLTTLIIFGFLFWIVPIMQASLSPWWAGDWVIMLTFFWGFYYLRLKKEAKKTDFWSFSFPFLVGMGAASFLFNSLLIYLPYFVFLGLLSYLIFLKSKWAMRPGEGALYVFFMVLSFFFLQGLIRTFFYGSTLDYQFLIKSIITTVICWAIWAGFFYTEGKGRIR